MVNVICILIRYSVVNQSISIKQETYGPNRSLELQFQSSHNLGDVRLKLAQYFWRKRSLNVVNVSSLYPYYMYLPWKWKRTEPFIWTNLNSYHPIMLCTKFGWKWPSGSGGNFKFRQCIMCTFYNFSLERDMDLHLHRLESPAPRNILLPSIDEIGPVALEKTIF